MAGKIFWKCPNCGFKNTWLIDCKKKEYFNHLMERILNGPPVAKKDCFNCEEKFEIQEIYPKLRNRK